MPNIVKQIGIQGSVNASPRMYDFLSDRAKELTDNFTTITSDPDFKYTYGSTNVNCTLNINANMLVNQELYFFITNSSSNKDITLTVKKPLAGVTPKMMCGGELESTTDDATATATIEPGKTFEVSVLKLNRDNGDATPHVYFVRGA